MKKAILTAFGCFYLTVNSLFAQWNVNGPNVYTLPSGNVGIGTTTPSSTLHLTNSVGSTYLTLNKPNSFLESGIEFTNNGIPLFFLWSDNDGTNDLRIEAVGLPGETDITPRLSIPFANKSFFY